MENERKQTVDSFRDQLKSLSNRVASLEATVAPAPVAARELEDKINGKVDSQSKANATPVPEATGAALGEVNIEVDFKPKVTEYVIDIAIDLPPWSVMEQNSMHYPLPDSFVKAGLHVHNTFATFARMDCLTHVRGAEHLPGPCEVCKTSPFLTHVLGRVT